MTKVIGGVTHVWSIFDNAHVTLDYWEWVNGRVSKKDDTEGLPRRENKAQRKIDQAAAAERERARLRNPERSDKSGWSVGGRPGREGGDWQAGGR